ncbi:hypothetical protein KR038_007528, partial [Drosophila bunnanda]
LTRNTLSFNAVLLLQLVGHGWGFQEKAPVQSSLVTGQARNDKQQQVLDDTLGSGRGIDEHLLKTIGKGGIKLVMASGASTTTPKPSVHQHHYYYPPEDQQHPRQYGYGPPPPWAPSPPIYPPPPQRPWGPPPPPPPVPGPQPSPFYNPYYNGYNYYGGYGGYGYPGYGGYPGFGGYPGYPFYPFYRSSAVGDGDNQGPGPDGLTPSPIPGVFQGRAVLSQNFLEGRNNANIVPLYHLLQMARA